MEQHRKEIEKRNHKINELNLDIQQLQQVKADLELKVSKLECNERNFQETVDNLNQKLIKQTQRLRLESAGTLKKKVENAVFQESADLRAKITELSEKIRLVELERWNVDKKLKEERAQYQRKLLDKEQSLAVLNEQNSRLQALLAKMENKLSKATTSVTGRKRKEDPPVNRMNRSTQTSRTGNRVRFVDNEVTAVDQVITQ